MRKNNLTFVVFLLVGLITGSIAAQLLSSVEWLAFMTNAVPFVWEPKADFDFLKYDFQIQVKLSLMSIVGLFGAFWLHRRI